MAKVLGLIVLYKQVILWSWKRSLITRKQPYILSLEHWEWVEISWFFKTWTNFSFFGQITFEKKHYKKIEKINDLDGWIKMVWMFVAGCSNLMKILQQFCKDSSQIRIYFWQRHCFAKLIYRWNCIYRLIVFCFSFLYRWSRAVWHFSANLRGSPPAQV